MELVKRVYAEKKKDFQVKAQELYHQIHDYLNINTLKNIRMLICYDIQNLTDETYNQALGSIFSEPPLDYIYEEYFPVDKDEVFFGVEYLPGQFDQRADSAEQCLKLLNENENPIVRSSIIYILKGNLSKQDIEIIKEYCINPVDSRESNREKPDSLIHKYNEPKQVSIIEGFINFKIDKLKDLYKQLHLAMTLDDFKHIHTYFKNEEKRNPTITEIRVLDTYWSDHCRHTTFLTELKNIKIEDGLYKQPIENVYKEYLSAREKLYNNKKDKSISLMDIALMAMKELRQDGLLDDLEESDEINACSIIVPVDINGKEEEWLVMFKNETHNHPTEIEPFGGAATCLGGAIRDPLSGRAYVYQAMRVTGCADPTVDIKQTISGKLPQRKITTESARGYSSYGNQIGLATGIVSEVYHPNYVTKRLEIGAVIAATPRENVIRGQAEPGDSIILLGGRTGRDGCGGATGSSKVHTEESILTCGAEVQKGNPPTERKIQRLFRNKKASQMIKKCNDFGAGGVSVAIGELADGLVINLDCVPKKYEGLDGTELAISESQERMAVVVDKENELAFIQLANDENLEAVKVAEVKEEKRLIMLFKDQKIVDISREFLDTNGAHQEMDATITLPNNEENYFNNNHKIIDFKQTWLNKLSDLNICSQKGLVEQFDSSIGAATILMPYGGEQQLTPSQTMVAKIPVLKGETQTATMMSYGYDPYLSSWSPFHGSIYAIVHAIAKIVASGGNYKKIRFTFQEYFKRLGDDVKRWGEPLVALLGAYEAQKKFELPSIGGKDSMSGSFNEWDVPPTLVAFAVDTVNYNNVISNELKEVGNLLIRVKANRDIYDLPDYKTLKILYKKVYKLINDSKVQSAYAIGYGGMCEAISKMAFGNNIGVKLKDTIDEKEWFKADYGTIIMEVRKKDIESFNNISYDVIGETTNDSSIYYQSNEILLNEALEYWEKTLESVFSIRTDQNNEEIIDTQYYNSKEIYICKNKIAKPTVFIPVFPGTNCEYDTALAFERAGAEVITEVFNNLDAKHIRDSIKSFADNIKSSQILMISGGFSAGDEPEGSGKFIANIFRNELIKEEVLNLLNNRDGLVLGICNGFQALIKLGLLPYGDIRQQKDIDPTLTTNLIGHHVSRMVNTKIVSNKSPWLSFNNVGDIHSIPVSHGEGRFVANEEWIQNLFTNGQVATQYVNNEGKPTMSEIYNPNGSYYSIEGITSPDGRILGKMGHSERIGNGVAKNIIGNQNQKIFEAGVKYFK